MAAVAATPSIMQMPPSRRSGSWQIARSDLDQQKLNEMAKVYFSASDLTILRQLTGRSNLTFDGEEIGSFMKSQSLVTAAVDATTKYDAKIRKPATAPNGYVQFYDMAATIDTLKSMMRMQYTHIMNDSVLNDALFEQVEDVVMYPDMIPRTIRKEKLKLPDDQHLLWSITGDKKETGAGIGAAFVSAPAPKNNLDRACDEVAFLSSPLMATMQALGQGLFIVHETTGNQLAINRRSNAAPFTDDKRPLVAGQWINTISPLVYFDEGGELKRDDYRDKPFYNTEGGVNVVGIRENPAPDADRVATFDANPGPNYTPINLDHPTEPARLETCVQVLQTKAGLVDTDKFYKWAPAYFTAAAGGGAMDMDFNQFSYSVTGGAIGHYIVTKNHQNHRVPDADHNKVIALTHEMVFKAMARFYYHPISSCPRLAEAYTQSGMHGQLVDMLQNLQRSLEAVSQRRNSRNTVNGFTVATMGSGQQVNELLPQCGAGFTHQFNKKTGDLKNPYQVVSEEEALVTRDGKLELASHIDRKKIECVPRITVAQVGGQMALNNLRFHPTIVPAVSIPAQSSMGSGPVRLDNITEVRMQNTDTNIFPDAFMGAYVIDKSQM